MDAVPQEPSKETNKPDNSQPISSDNQKISDKEEIIMPQDVEPDDEVSNNLNDNSIEEDSARSESDVSEHSGTESGDVDVGDDPEEVDDASVILEREEGDGQESTPNRKVDDDEDKRNPQYIPKRGTFYEHDDRTAVDEDVEGEETEEKDRSEKDLSKKKVWSEASRWAHDRYNDMEQAPKSRNELVSIYGYDIRNEEGPPRARRRRRYGRGPNKYTRNWEDEDAYSKIPTVTSRGGRKPRSRGEEFPPLEDRRRQSQSKTRIDQNAGGDSQAYRSNTPPENTNISQETGNRVDTSQDDTAPASVQKIEPQIKAENINNKQIQKQPAPKKENKEPREVREQRDQRPVMRTIRTSTKVDETRGSTHGRGVTRTRGFRAAGRGDTRNRSQKTAPPEDNSEYIMSQNFTNKNVNPQVIQDVEKDMSNLNIQESGYSRGGKFNTSRQTSVPPRLAEQRGSKRYSSLRQKSLPETGAAQPSFGQQQHPVMHFAPEYAQQNPPQQNQQPLLPHPTPSIVSQVPANNTQQIIAVQANAQPMGQIPHQGPANGAQILQAPPIPAQFAAPYPQGPPAFLQTGVAPPPFIPPQGMTPPQIINYAQPPPQFPQPDFANFQHQQFAPVNPPPADVYQASQGGITYYSMQSQHSIPRVQAKRPKAAIPIVPPPEHKEPRGRGRLNQGEESPVGGTPDVQKENYEVENNGMQYGGSVVVQQ